MSLISDSFHQAGCYPGINRSKNNLTQCEIRADDSKEYFDFFNRIVGCRIRHGLFLNLFACFYKCQCHSPCSHEHD